MEQEKFKKLVADNITFYRKRVGLTQLQLAEKLNYSDKAVSKWERGDGLPDLMVLNKMADLFGITLNDFTKEPFQRKINLIRRNKIVISLLSAGLVWLVATLVFVLISLVAPSFKWGYMSFIYALPVSFIVLLVFSAIWKNRILVFITYSGLVWTLLLSIFLSISVGKSAYLFIIGAPLQVLGLLMLFLVRRKDKTNQNNN